jgi:preprotein translocase subunit SecG
MEILKTLVWIVNMAAALAVIVLVLMQPGYQVRSQTARTVEFCCR